MTFFRLRSCVVPASSHTHIARRNKNAIRRVPTMLAHAYGFRKFETKMASGSPY